MRKAPGDEPVVAGSHDLTEPQEATARDYPDRY
jgi:hypothetical protein